MASAPLVRARLVPPGVEAAPDGFTRLSTPLVNGIPETIDLDAELALVLLVPSGVATTWRDADPADVVSRSGPEREPRVQGTASKTTGSIPFDAGAVHVQAALEATFGQGHFATVGGPLPATPVMVEFTGAFATRDVARMTAAPTFVGGATPEIEIVEATATAGANERQTITITGSPTGGAFRLTWTPPPPAPVGAVERSPVRLVLRRAGAQSAAVPLVAGLRRLCPAGGDDGGVPLELAVLAWDIRAGSLRGAGDFGSHIELAWRRADTAADRFEPPPLHPRVAARLERDFRLQSQLGTRASANGKA